MAENAPDDGAGVLIVAGGITGIALLMALGVWSATMTVASAAIAPGQVTVAGHRKAVQASNGGPVKAVLVKEGDHVTVGQPLVRA